MEIEPVQNNAGVVIYHSADFDGLFCREIARKFLPGAELIGWNYGDPVPDVWDAVNLWILDLSIPELMHRPKLVWIDHHKTAIDQYSPAIPGYRIDGVAACRLAWQWFLLNTAWDPREMHPPFELPGKQDFIDRKVSEPWAVRLAGEYDIWDKRDSDAELFQHGLKSEQLTPGHWEALLSEDQYTASGALVVRLLNQGRALQYARIEENKSIITRLGFTLNWNGLTFLACNHASFNSHLFTAGLTPEHDACLGFKFNGQTGYWDVSLYHAPGKEHHDLSVIAKFFGGGGHKGACGFRTKELFFLP